MTDYYPDQKVRVVPETTIVPTGSNFTQIDPEDRHSYPVTHTVGPNGTEAVVERRYHFSDDDVSYDVQPVAYPNEHWRVDAGALEEL